MKKKRKGEDLSRAVVQYGTNGEKLEVFISVASAVAFMGKTGKSAGNGIRSACRGQQHLAYGYQWRWEGDEPPGEYKPKKRAPAAKTEKTCLRCGRKYMGSGRNRYCSGECRAALRTARENRRDAG